MTSKDEKIELKANSMPTKYRAIYRKAVGGKSLRAAATSFCLECVCWQREEVRRCSCVTCPLYPYRPYQGQDDD